MAEPPGRTNLVAQAQQNLIKLVHVGFPLYFPSLCITLTYPIGNTVYTLKVFYDVPYPPAQP